MPSIAWRYKDHRDGESAEFTVCGLHVYVGDADGDWSWWTIRVGRLGRVIAEGEEFGIDHFDEALAKAEAALRKIVTDRIQELRERRLAQAGR